MSHCWAPLSGLGFRVSEVDDFGSGLFFELPNLHKLRDAYKTLVSSSRAKQGLALNPKPFKVKGHNLGPFLPGADICLTPL